MKATVFGIICLGTVLTAGPSYLARIDLGPGQTVNTLGELGVAVVQEFSGYCLARLSEPELNRLISSGWAVQILDENSENKNYLYVLPARGFDRSRLSSCGKVLTEDEQGLLLLVEEPAILELNRLPVELCRISMTPLPSGAEPAPPAPFLVEDSLVQALVDRVSADSVLAHIRRLQNFYTRYSTTDSCRAAVQWIQTLFTAYGCDSTALETYRSNYAPNVIGAKFGTVNRRPIWVICGHVDNTSDYAPQRCPGSDDNGSGTAAVIEACRVFQGIQFDNTVYFIGFTGEEQGLYGSDSFCTRAWRRGDSIKAALNFDMISYGRQNIDTFEVIGKISNPACAWLVDSFIANAQQYTTLKTHRTLLSNPPANSDHASFLRRGWPAFCGIENDFTPMYHTIGDTIGPLYYRYSGTNNWLMATEAIKAAVATIAKFAGAHQPVGVQELVSKTPRPAPEVLGITPTVGRAPVRLTHVPSPEADARLQILDISGRVVRTVTERSGWSWDGKDDDGKPAGPGVYLFRLSEGNTSWTGRFVLAE